MATIALPIAFNQGGGSGGQTSIVYACGQYTTNYSKIYLTISYWSSDSRGLVPISSVSVPTKAYNLFQGYTLQDNQYITNKNGSLKTGSYVIEYGYIYGATATAVWHNYITVTWEYSNPFYKALQSGEFFSDTALTQPLSSVTIPTKTGYTYVDTKYGEVVCFAADGTITSEFIATRPLVDITIVTTWQANTYTLFFDYHGGTQGIASKSVVYDSPIGTLPTSSRASWPILDWRVDDAVITDTTIWKFPQDKTAVARYTSFSETIDYFNLASSALSVESSDSGDGRLHICAYNINGTSPSTGDEVITATSGIWRNPRVTYRVTADTTLNVTLGAAFPGVGSTISGYMITAVEVRTTMGDAPTVTVSGVANEGVNAVKTYNISIPLLSRHRPQNLLSALDMTNHGDLQELTIVAQADPVVCSENDMPCASDVARGRIEASAVIAAYADESNPPAGTGFVLTGEPYSNSGKGYKMWNVKARKEL